MAYAAVVSLAQSLKLLLQSDHLPPHYPKLKLQSLHQNVSSLQTSLEKLVLVPKNKRDAVKKLESRISDAIYKAQDAIESFLSKQSETEKIAEEQTVFLQELQEIIENISPITKDTKEISDLIRKQTGVSLSEDTRSAKTTFSTKIKIVGQDEDRRLVMNELKSDTTERQVIPIIGTRGIGKTTLARSVYENQDIENHFNVRAWVTVSSDYKLRDIFVKLHSSLATRGQKSDDSGSMKNIGDIVNQERADLALQLYQKLYDSRYLIVIDDLWENGVWDELNNHFPDRKNGSRIILTTRDKGIADYIVKPSEFHHQMRLLNLEDSWTLLCGRVYEEGDSKALCPPNFVKIGMSIAANCQGHPLSLTLVGGLLVQKIREDYWKFVEEETKVAAASSKNNEDACLEILSLIYNHLPEGLKACLLYMGAFPEGSEILASKLIKLWVAEGFLARQAPLLPEIMEQAVEDVLTLLPPPPRPETLERLAEQTLEDLAARNLIFVRRLTSDGYIKSCGINESMREIAMEESADVEFAISKHARKLPEVTRSRRRLCFHKNTLLCVQEVYESAKALTSLRTLLFAGPQNHCRLRFPLTFELLRVLDALAIYFIRFPSEVIKMIHLRYLSLTYNRQLPSSVSQLQNLQILIVCRHPKIIFTGKSILPVEIWNMPQLRHLVFTESELPLIPSSAEHSVLLKNLQTLSNVNAHSFTREVVQNIPNLKKLGIWVDRPGEVPICIEELEQLQALKFTVPYCKLEFLPLLIFPRNLRKLSLRGCGFPWEDMIVIAQLPHLQVLKLREMAFKGEYWILDGMKFRALKFLLLECLDLQLWGTDDYDEAGCFPSLERLIIRHCYDLEDIPEDLGNIGVLELIELVDGSPSAVESAKEIREKQKDYKMDFQVRIDFSRE